MINPLMLSRKLIQASTLDWRAIMTKGCGIRYILSKWNAILFNKRQMIYLGHPINYDCYLAPFFMFSLVDEIEEHVLKYITSNQPKILDIGANYGRWAQTVKSKLPNAKLYSFEPNMEIFDILQINSDRFDEWFVFNYGLSSMNASADFFYIPGKSGQGSLYESNAILNVLSASSPKKIKVNLRRFADTVLNEKGITQFDFVKIDVEGAELDVIQGLVGIEWKFMYVEATRGEGRQGSNEQDLLDEIIKSWGDVEILERTVTSANTIDLLLRATRFC